jgi:aminoglycoside 6'-N-acetyltransferase I
MLCEAAERWAQSKGLRELASDALIDNTVSHQMHRKLGFEETECVVYFKKWIKAPS